MRSDGSASWSYDPLVNLRSMRSHEIDAAVDVWREANIARGAPHGPERTARIRAKISAPDGLPFVALRPGVIGMALAEPGRFEDGAGGPDPSLLHISMVFVLPTAQRTGVGLPLVLHIFDVARSMGYERVGVWTARENSAARGLYERAGMTLTGKTTSHRSSVALQYECLLNVGTQRGPSSAPSNTAERNSSDAPALEVIHRPGERGSSCIGDSKTSCEEVIRKVFAPFAFRAATSASISAIRS